MYTDPKKMAARFAENMDTKVEGKQHEAALERAREKRRQASAEGCYEAAEYWANYAHDIEAAIKR